MRKMACSGGQEWTAEHRNVFEKWINYKILKWSLISVNEHYKPASSDESCSTSHDDQSIVEHLWSYFNSKGDEKGSGYQKLVACLKHSLEEGHLGHDSLLELLTRNSDILESDDYRCNVVVRQIVRANLTSFIRQTNLRELLPFMYQKELLTLAETTKLLPIHAESDNGADYILTELLDTKGHRGYIVFVECLKDSVNREGYHSGHYDIIKLVDLQLKSKGLYIGKCTGNEGVQL